MAKFVAYPFSVIYYFFFSFLLLIFHPIQVFSLRFFGLNTQKKSVDYLNILIIRTLLMLGIRVRFKNPHRFPENRILIFVSNHQSTYDIPPLIWYLRAHFPKFIAKKELGKGIPSISFNLRHGGAFLIDRKRAKHAISSIEKFAQRVSKNKWSIVIFPEGTRTRNGQVKPFQRVGLRTILNEIPNALLVPISVNNSWKLARWSYFPMPLGIRLDFCIHKPIDPIDQEIEKTIDQIEEAIKSGVKI